MLTVGLGDVAAVAELFSALEVPDFLDEGSDLGFVADGGVSALGVGEFADSGDEVVSLSAGLAIRDAGSDARDDVSGDAHNS